MPELPEVETVARSLQKLISGKKITSINIIFPNIIENTEIPCSAIINQTIKSVNRRAKYIILYLETNIIAVHLRMTGKLYITDRLNLKHIHVIITLNKKEYLVYENVRKFGRISILNNVSDIKQTLGIEPLSDKFNFDWCKQHFLIKNRQIKALLLDQSFIAGLGNIYIDEALWMSKIHPLQISSKISSKKLRNLHESIINILTKSIRYHGTTIRDFVFEGFRIGDYSSQLQVFNKTGLPCPRCYKPIIKLKVASRGTHICINCQRLRN